MSRSSLALAIVVIVAVGAQFVRPNMANPQTDPSRTVTANERVPPDVASALQRACHDCHSNETRWPWYAQISPVSWFLANHVSEGRRELNFSEWGTFNARRRSGKLREICEQVQQGKMPLKSYLWLHADAGLSDGETKAICAWTNDIKASASGAH